MSPEVSPNAPRYDDSSSLPEPQPSEINRPSAQGPSHLADPVGSEPVAVVPGGESTAPAQSSTVPLTGDSQTTPEAGIGQDAQRSELYAETARVRAESAGRPAPGAEWQYSESPAVDSPVSQSVPTSQAGVPAQPQIPVTSQTPQSATPETTQPHRAPASSQTPVNYEGAAQAQAPTPAQVPSEPSQPIYGALSSQQQSWILDGQEQVGDASQFMSARNEAQEAQEDSGRAPSAESDQSKASFPWRRNDQSQSTPEPFNPNNSSYGAPANTGYGQSTPQFSSPNSAGGPTLSGGYGPGGPQRPGYFGGLQQPAGPSSGSNRPLPGRAWPIVMLVVGLVSMLILAPVATFGGLAYYVISVAENTTEVSGQNQYEVEGAFSGYTLVTANASERGLWDCKVTFNGTEVSPTAESNSVAESISSANSSESNSSVAVFNEVYSLNGSGKLAIDCQNLNNSSDTLRTIVVAPDIKVTSMIWPIIAGTVVGLAGLGLTIGGIVWLVRRNRDRRRILLGDFR